MNRIPRHVSIIMDGNGRWAKARGMERLHGHKEGSESVRTTIEFAAENRIEYLSLFAFSEENWNRPEDEVNGLMQLMVDAIAAETATIMKNNIKFRAIGDLSKLSEDIAKKIYNAEEMSSHNTGLNLIIFLSYAGKWDILQAAEKYSEEVLRAYQDGRTLPKLTADHFNSLLSTKGIPDPDLIIRTSGEQRISNYLLWQSAYSEFYFPEVLWPDFRKTHFQQALDIFAQRERRFGKTGDQLNNS